MDEWCIENHGKVSEGLILFYWKPRLNLSLPKTGLTEACRKSQHSIERVEEQLLAYISRFVAPKQSPMAGNSIYMDRLFMKKDMHKIDEFLHYRLVDVSTIKELCRRWHPEVNLNVPKKRLIHRALADIEDSIEELKYYRKHLFKESREWNRFRVRS